MWAQKRYLDFRANTLSVRRQLYWQAGGYPAFRVGQDMMLIARLNDLRRGYLDYRQMGLYRRWGGQVTDDSYQIPWQLDAMYREFCLATERTPHPEPLGSNKLLDSTAVADLANS